MARHCSVCVHPKRDDVNRRLLRIGESGESLASIGEAYGLSSSAIDRHKANHLRVSAGLVSEAKNALTIVGYASDLHARAIRIAERAERMLDAVQEGDMPSRSVQAASASLRELRGSIELLAKLVVTAPPEPEPQSNSWLDAAITEAVQALSPPALPAPQVQDAEVAEGVLVEVPD